MARYAEKRIPRYREPREVLETKELSERTKILRGETVHIPQGVPDHAYAQIKPKDDNFFEVLWTWQREVDGKRMGMKSIHPRKGSFQAGYKPTFAPKYARPNVRSNKAIEKIRQDNKKLKEMLDESKRQSEAYHRAKAGLCECTEEIIQSGNGEMISLEFKTCEYHKNKAVKAALLTVNERRRSTGDMGPG
jgi:hypothetical protein